MEKEKSEMRGSPDCAKPEREPVGKGETQGKTTVAGETLWRTMTLI